jgi:hypothetical protein
VYCHFTKRAISLLPSLTKVYEKIIHDQLRHYFTQNNQLFSSQSGFRPKYSMDLAAAELVVRVIKLLDAGNK